jgi:hypothetical protein
MSSQVASRETSRLLWNPNVHYRSHKSPPLVPILSQLNPVQTFTPSFLKNSLKIFPPSAARFSNCTLTSMFSTKILYIFLNSPARATCPAHILLPRLINLIMLREEYKL